MAYGILFIPLLVETCEGKVDVMLAMGGIINVLYCAAIFGVFLSMVILESNTEEGGWTGHTFNEMLHANIPAMITYVLTMIRLGIPTVIGGFLVLFTMIYWLYLMAQSCYYIWSL